MISPYAQRTVQPPLFTDGGGYAQNWGNVGNRGWDSRPYPSLDGSLGFIVPDIVGPLDGSLPVLQGFNLTAAGLAVGILGIGIGIAAPAFGAYKGAKTSPGWAAGGAVIGMVAAGLTNAILAAIVGASIVQAS